MDALNRSRVGWTARPARTPRRGRRGASRTAPFGRLALGGGLGVALLGLWALASGTSWATTAMAAATPCCGENVAAMLSCAIPSPRPLEMNEALLQRDQTDWQGCLADLPERVLNAAWAAAQPTGAVYLIGTQDEWAAALERAQPGDHIVIRDGRYADRRFEVPEQIVGRREAPLTIRPESAGGVTFTGRTRINLRGSFLRFAGFRFDEVEEYAVNVIGDDNTVAGLVFSDSGSRRSPFPPIVAIHFQADRNTVEHSVFVGNTSMGISVRVGEVEANTPRQNVIRGNHFERIRRETRNGREPIQLGQGGHGRRALTETLVEYNTFYRADGDRELISNKTAGNTIRRNIAVDSRAAIVLRGGDSCIVEENILLGTDGGVRISGANHVVRNNVALLTKNFGILVTNGSRHYARVADTVITNNTIVARRRAFVFARFNNDPDAPLAEGNRIERNLFVVTNPRAQLLLRRESGQPGDLQENLSVNVFAGNVWSPSRQLPQALTAAESGGRRGDAAGQRVIFDSLLEPVVQGGSADPPVGAQPDWLRAAR